MSKIQWCDGTVLLAAVLERFAPGQRVVITREEVEKLGLGTSHPVTFTLGTESDECVVLEVTREKRDDEKAT